ncbi:MAG: (d)CMP kinase [Geminicoccaceae bacterium]
MALTVAIDGPASSGKSTIGKRLADELDLTFLDTGLLYRAVAHKLLRDGPSDDGGDEIPAGAVDSASHLTLADLDHPELSDEEVGAMASTVAALAPVREALLPFQRRIASSAGGALLAGRDIGSVVCPDADRKIFVTATAEVRARRRLEQLHRRGRAAIYDEVLAELRRRDQRDRERAASPLIVAEDAFLLDTSEISVEEAVDRARSFIIG